MTDRPARPVRALVVGGGQAGLAAAFYLRRRQVEHVVLDDQDRPGGAWLHTWGSLRLFSPAAYSSLPGWRMPHTAGEGYPEAGHVIDYLSRYEERYDIPVSTAASASPRWTGMATVTGCSPRGAPGTQRSS